MKTLLATCLVSVCTVGLPSQTTWLVGPGGLPQIRDAVATDAISATNPTAAETARLNRVRLAVFLALASPEFIVQK